MTDTLLKSQAFKLKGRLYTLTVLHLLEQDQSLFEHYLDEVVAKAPRMFDNAPLVLDLSQINNEALDLQALCQNLRQRNIVPVAVQGANPVLASIAQCAGLGVLHASTNHDKPLFEEPQDELPTPLEPIKNKLVTTPVRSGQQVVCKGGDLVITSTVSHGAELLADGNIHVYGALRGRALAGMSGDKQARIFCQALEADLVSIAGFYRLSDGLEGHTGPCQIYLRDEHIHIEPLC